MKKILLVGALALFGAMNAQTKFGVKAGYVLSSMTAKMEGEKESTDPKSSFYVGALVEHKFDEKWAIQGEVLYADLGGKEKYSDSEEVMGQIVNYNVDAKVNLGTILVPVSAKYFVNEAFAINAGLNFGFIMSAKAKGTVTATVAGQSVSESEDQDVKDSYKSLNLAPFIGAEYNLAQGIFFDARYNFGVSNIAEGGDSNNKITNSFFQVGVGYKF